MASRLRRLCGLVLVGLLIALPVSEQRGSGQIQVVPAPPLPVAKGKAAESKSIDAVTLPRNPESKRLIQAARDYIKKAEWRIAAECLQTLLDSPDDSFIEVKRKDAAGVELDLRVSVRDEANRIIGELPAEGLESYQIQYGQGAAERLRDAIEKADPAVLAEVSQRFLHTKAGLEATDLLGTYHLDRGQYLMATLCYERLLARPDVDKLSPKVLFKAALAYRRSGNVASSDKMFARLSERMGRGDLSFGKARFSLDQLRAEIERDVGVDVLAGSFDWPIFRGNASRTAQCVGSTAFLEPQWSVSLFRPDEPVDASDKPAVAWIEQHLDNALLTLKNADKPILPAFFPVTVNDKLLVRTYHGVSAYAVKSSADGKYRPGDMIWRQTAENSLFATVRDDAKGKRMALENWYNTFYRSNSLGPVGVFFENSVIGSLSHDGRRVYFVDDLAVPPHASMLFAQNQGFGGPGVPAGPFANEIKFNRLFAADLEQEGKLCWIPLGGKSLPSTKLKDEKEDRRELSTVAELQDSFFLGPPLPLGGKLYLLCEKNAELRLLCLDPEKLVTSRAAPKDKVPELLWVQTLGTANAFKLPDDGLRRMQAAHLAYGDGILVCPTNAGAVIGVDLLSHSLVWAYSYLKDAPNPLVDENLVFQRFPGRRFQPQNPTPTNAERWRTAAPCISKGKVVFTAHNGPEIHCLNLRDGRRVWANPRDDANDLYLAGVFDDRVIVVAKNSVRALSLDTGKEIWKRYETGMPSGQGVAANGTYYLPLANAADPKASDKGPEICAIDIKTGAIQGRSKSRRETPGNLLFVEGELISQTPKTLASFPLLKVKQGEIDRYLAKNPNDATGLTERGELHLYNGSIRQAVADLRVALANQPPAVVRTKARSKLHEALTLTLQRDFIDGEQYLGEYEELCRMEVPAEAEPEVKQKLAAEGVRRRAAYLELLGKGRERQGRVLDAFAAYEQYGTLVGHKELVDSLDEPNTKARPDIWSRGRIQALINGAKSEDKLVLESEIAKRFEKFRSDAGFDGLRQFVSIYGSISAAGKSARLELAERLLSTGDPDDLNEAERLLAVLCYSPSQRREDPAVTVRAIESMIRVCVRRGQYENAVGFYRQLGDEFAELPVRDGRTGKELFDELITDKRFVPYLETPALLWPGPFSTREQQGSFRQTETTVAVEPLGELLPFFDRHRVVIDMKPDGGQSSWTMRLLDRLTGEERWRVPNLPAATYFANNQPPASFAFARGHDLIVQLNNIVYAFDLVAKRELWRYNLCKDATLNGQTHNMAFDPNFGPIVLSQDEKKIYVGRIAVVEAGYICLQTRDGLVAVDPTRPGPSVMWIKTDVTPKAQVFGDDRHLFVFDAEANKSKSKCTVLRTQDGVAVAAIPDFAEALAKKIRVLGGRLLIADSGTKALRLYDAATGNNLWKREFANNSVVVKCDDEKLVGVIETGGLFTLLDARDGEVRFTSRLQPDHAEKLKEATLVTDRDRYYLALDKSAERGMRWESAAPTMRTVEVNGPLYALARRSGKLEWVCDFLPHQRMVLDRMTDLPVLLFASQYSKSTANGAMERQGVRVTGVSKNSGKLVFDRDFVPNPNNQFHALNADAAKGRIELVRLDLKVVFLTQEGARHPEPKPVPGSSQRTGQIFMPVMPQPQLKPGR